MTHQKITYHSPCKFNLFLDVTGRRPDGFHEVATIIEPLSLSDTLHLQETSGEISVTSDQPEIPDGPDNIVYQAVRLLREETGEDRGVRIRVEKNIPAAAGLGGGSANAARTLQTLNSIWKLNLPPPALSRIAARLGSDVPFFLNPRTSHCRGRGEMITPLPRAPRFQAVLIKPPLPIPTRWAYEQLAISAPLSPRRNIQDIITALENSDLSALGSSLYNIFQEVLEPKIPELRNILEFFRKNNTIGAILSGSGSTVVGLLETEFEAQSLADQARAIFPGEYFIRVATNLI